MPSDRVSAFSKTQLPPEVRRVLSCELLAVFLHFPLEEKGPWGPFYQLRRVPAKEKHLLQILKKALQGVGEKKKKNIVNYVETFFWGGGGGKRGM